MKSSSRPAVGLRPAPHVALMLSPPCPRSVVRRADRPHGGMLVDSGRFFRGAPDLDALRAVPGGRIAAIHVNDAPATPGANLREETVHHRLPPGDGAFDLAAWMGALPHTPDRASEPNYREP